VIGVIGVIGVIDVTGGHTDAVVSVKAQRAHILKGWFLSCAPCLCGERDYWNE
jgi:hypothetical protein